MNRMLDLYLIKKVEKCSCYFEQVMLHKVSAEIQEMKISSLEQKIFDLLMNVVKEKAPDTILRVAGGWVRDRLLGKESNDIDIAVSNLTGENFAKLLKEYVEENNIKFRGDITIFKNNPLKTAMMNIMDTELEFVNLRTEKYTSGSRTPTMEFGTVEEDASRRDLTINSIFYNINTREIEDFVGGIEDLKNNIARTPIDSVKTFMDDPLRILRTIRFAAKYDLELSQEIIEAANLNKVKEAFRTEVKMGRLFKEFGGERDSEGNWKAGFMGGPNPAKAAELMAQVGFRDILLGLNEEEQEKLGLTKGMVSFESEQHNPHHDLTIWLHTVQVLKYLVKNQTTQEQQDKGEDFLVRNLSALLHDVGKCDICTIQMFPKSHPEYQEKINKLLHKYNLEHEGDLWTFQGHADSSAKIATHVLQRLGAPSRITKRVKLLVEKHMQPHQMVNQNISNKALRKFIKSLGDDWRNSLDLAIADAHGKEIVDPNERQKYIAIIDRALELSSSVTQKPPINGKDLIDVLGFKPGKEIGIAIKALGEKLLETPNMSKDEALDFIKSLNL